jgi:hypothetical protein
LYEAKLRYVDQATFNQDQETLNPNIALLKRTIKKKNPKLGCPMNNFLKKSINTYKVHFKWSLCLHTCEKSKKECVKGMKGVTHHSFGSNIPF